MFQLVSVVCCNLGWAPFTVQHVPCLFSDYENPDFEGSCYKPQQRNHRDHEQLVLVVS